MSRLARGEYPISQWNHVLGHNGVTFATLQARLILEVKRRIDNGEYTERGLARVVGVSQSQIHNVLKGARRMQIQLADRLLAKLGLSVLDLAGKKELDAAFTLKINDFDRRFPATQQTLNFLESPEMKPPGREELKTRAEIRKTG